MLSSRIRGSEAAGRGAPVHTGRHVSAGGAPDSHARNMHDSGTAQGAGVQRQRPQEKPESKLGWVHREDLGSVSRDTCHCDTLFVILLPFQVTASKILNDRVGHFFLNMGN